MTKARRGVSTGRCVWKDAEWPEEVVSSLKNYMTYLNQMLSFAMVFISSGVASTTPPVPCALAYAARSRAFLRFSAARYTIVASEHSRIPTWNASNTIVADA